MHSNSQLKGRENDKTDVLKIDIIILYLKF